MCDVWQVLWSQCSLVAPAASTPQPDCWWMWELMDLQWFPVGWRWTRTSTGHLTGTTSNCQCRISETWNESAGNYSSRLGSQELAMFENKTNSARTSWYFPISSLWSIGEEYEEKIWIHRHLSLHRRTGGNKNQWTSDWPSWRAPAASATTSWGLSADIDINIKWISMYLKVLCVGRVDITQ